MKAAHVHLGRQLREYLAYRRSLGFELEAGEVVLRDFVRYVRRERHTGPLTAPLMLRWATAHSRHSVRYQAERLSLVRGLARYLAARDGLTEIPEQRLLGSPVRRGQPHIYSDEQLRALIKAAGAISSSDPLRPSTYATLFGLLACTGMRVSEGLALKVVDVDLHRGVLHISRTKFRKARLVPMHATAVAAIRRYAGMRNRTPTAASSDWFFMGHGTSPLPYRTLLHVFRRLCLRQGWRGNGDRPAPQIHDMRHTFAVGRLLQWYRAGVDIEQAIPALSTYLGHGKVTDTYWYLTGVRELLATCRSEVRALRGRRGGRAMRHPQTGVGGLLGPVLQDFFCEYLINQRRLSPRTVESYRDTFKLLLGFLERDRHVRPDELRVADLDADCVLGFLDDLERTRRNCARSRNARLAAIRSFFRFALSRDPVLLPVAQRVFAVPSKRFERRVVVPKQT